MFQFPPYALAPYLTRMRVTGFDSCWVSPFGNVRVNASLAALRTLSWPFRPSSPTCPKASTSCPESLIKLSLRFISSHPVAVFLRFTVRRRCCEDDSLLISTKTVARPCLIYSSPIRRSLKSPSHDGPCRNQAMPGCALSEPCILILISVRSRHIPSDVRCSQLVGPTFVGLTEESVDPIRFAAIRLQHIFAM